MENKKLLEMLKTLEKYPLEVIFAKEIILNGIQTEEEFVDLLQTHTTLAYPTKVKLQNAYRDIKNGFYDINKIPNFKA
jgi:hypothetical protein